MGYNPSKMKVLGAHGKWIDLSEKLSNCLELKLPKMALRRYIITGEVSPYLEVQDT